MFSPSAAAAEGGPATATRSRRRQRPKSQESLVQQPKAKRQRLPLTQQTFVNPEAAPEMTEVKDTKLATLDTAGKKQQTPERFDRQPTPRKESNVRARKSKHADRAANKGDGSLLLTSTNAYTVSKLPALPDRLRADWTGPQHAALFASTGYALNLTPTHAIVWMYTSSSASPETFAFTLPSASRPNDPLPVGCLVSPSASSTEPGLVVVLAGSGKVIYWESISSAATFPFIRRDRSGVEYVISGLTSGEKVVAITNAESAGFVLTFNTGRLAYMNVRDNHGRPSISVHFLRSNLGSSSGGILGSIRHAFSHLSLRGEIAAVRADRSARVGEKCIVALTTKGRLQAWQIHRGGHTEPLGEADVRESIIAAVHDVDPTSQNFPDESFEALDFTYVPKGLEQRYLNLSGLSAALASDTPEVQQLLALVSFSRKSESRYALVELVMSPSGCTIGMVRPITTYTTRHSLSDSLQALRPRVHLPRPALVAFLVFDRATVIASVANVPESPESQLQSDNHILPASFEDVVDFREDGVHEIIGSEFEELPAVASTANDDPRVHRHKTKNPGVALMVREAGIIRITTTDVDRFASDKSPQVSAKSKFEQAVFFGVKRNNPLQFDQRHAVSFSPEETRQAALDVSQEILSSSSVYMSTMPIGMEDNLRARAEALERLNTHLKSVDADLDRITRWQLLWNAEKMHAALSLWKKHEGFTSNRSSSDKKGIIAYIVEFIHQDEKSNPIAEIGEVDQVRHWFMNDVFRLELFVAWAYEVIKVLYKDRLLDDAKTTVMMLEAVHVNVAAHRAAAEFRTANLTSYGLGEEDMKLGIMKSGYEGLPAPWTGCQFVANNVKRLVDLVDSWVVSFEKTDGSERTATQPDQSVIMKLADEQPVLIDAMLTRVLEFTTWALTSPDQATLGQNFKEVYQEERYNKPLMLAERGKWEQAAVVARKHGSLAALAAVLLSHIEYLEQVIAERPKDSHNSKKSLKELKKLEVEDAFIQYGEEFGFPLYDWLLEKHGIEAVMQFALDKEDMRTRYLRSRPELARVSWINDVQNEKDIRHAADMLIDLGMHKEQQSWSKKVELSLGKLALLADEEDQKQDTQKLKVQKDDARREKQIRRLDSELTAIKVQDQLFAQIYPTVFAAVDEGAALNLAMDAHASGIPKRQKALYQLFEDSMKRLLKHQVLDAMSLIDLLTLASLKPEAREEIPHPSWLALMVAESTCHSDEVKDAKRLIWRRLLTRDDWSQINDTSLKRDHEVVEGVAETELFAAFVDCIQNQDQNAPFRPPNPKEVAGVFTTSLDRRFRDFDASFQSKLVDAMKLEDKHLQQFLDKHRLADWVAETFKTAQEEVRLLADEATAQGAEAVVDLSA